MKKQQVISRFFAPKAAPSVHAASPSPAPRHANVCGTVQWPPPGSPSAKRLKQDFCKDPSKKRPGLAEEEKMVDSSSRDVAPPTRRLLSTTGKLQTGGIQEISEDEVEVIELDAVDNFEKKVHSLQLKPCAQEKLKEFSQMEEESGTAGVVQTNRRKRKLRTLATDKEMQSDSEMKQIDQLGMELGQPVELDGVEAVTLDNNISTQNLYPLDASNLKQESPNIHSSPPQETPFPDLDSSDSLHLHAQEANAQDTSQPSPSCREPRMEMAIPPSDPARHKKFIEKLLVGIDDNDAAQQITRSGKAHHAKEKYTPLERQVVELKAKYTDVILMVEVGYRYRFFGEDAEIASRVLGVFAHNDHSFLTASIPTFRLHVHVRRLVEAGYKVGVVRQTETAAIKAHGVNKMGPFTRGLSALYTRATLEAAEDLGGGETTDEKGRCSSYLMCVAEQPELSVQASKRTNASPSSKKSGRSVQNVGDQDAEVVGKGVYDTTIGVIAVETATGDVMYGQFKDTILRAELEAHLLTCMPAELLLATPLSSATEKLLMDFAGPASNIRVERAPRNSLDSGGALPEVLAFYGKGGVALSHNQDVLVKANEEEDKVDECLEAVMAMPELVIQALALALQYLKQFGLERVLRLGASFRPFAGVGEISLSSNTLRQLEILQNSTDGTEKGSLLWLMDHTHTAFGARLFHHWLTHPLRDRALILARLDAVADIAESMGSIGVTQNEGTFPGSGRGGGAVGAASRGRIEGAGKDGPGLLASILISLKKMPDIERGITRIFHCTATAAEFVSVIQALITAARQLQRLCSDDDDNIGNGDPCAVKEKKGTGSQLLKRLFSEASSSVVSENATRLLSSLNKEAASAGDKHNLFTCAGGQFPMVSKCRAEVKAAEKHLEALLPVYRKSLKLPNLQYMSVLGTTHLIEVPIALRVPPNWIKVNSTQKTHRYHPPEVLGALDSLALAKEGLTVECNKAWDAFLADFASHYVGFRAAVQALAALDCLYSLAIVSRNQGYTRPEIVDESEPSQLWIECGRHPVLESTLQDGFVPNDTFLHSERERCQIITGPNMGGKSCYIRQVALIAIMAQIGSYIPAARAKLHVLDAIYTRLGASDSIQRGSSTFLEELSEASAILQTATSHSLVIVDELGRGTSTHDGVAIAYATMEHLLKVRCLTLFVTHYPKLAELKDKYLGAVGTYFVSYLAEQPASLQNIMVENLDENINENAGQGVANEAAQKITFLYKLVEGVASRSFGLHVARLAQIPESCVLRAAAMSAKFEKEVSSRALMLGKDGSHDGGLIEPENKSSVICTNKLTVGQSPLLKASGLDTRRGCTNIISNFGSNAAEGEVDRCVEVQSNSVPLEISEDFLSRTNSARVSVVLSTLLSALKSSSSKEAMPIFKNAQEQSNSILNVRHN